ncbi:bifunctional DNA primase/polymerase [Pararhodobacter sp.]|uniref:bifunctional DNA primase/polymerase n=1 Tax=Pararhodobacter sp. TaxID=2127056 RepID=UPI002FDD6F3F
MQDSNARSAIQSPRYTDLSELLGSDRDNLAVALDLARRGFAVFPQRDWGDGDGWKPIKDFPSKASTDPACIRAWWAKWPEARVALLTGERNGISGTALRICQGHSMNSSLLVSESIYQQMIPTKGRTHGAYRKRMEPQIDRKSLYFKRFLINLRRMETGSW